MALVVGTLLASCLTIFLLLMIVTPAIVLCNLACRLLSNGSLPQSLPWAGARSDSSLSRARATLTSFFGMKDLITKGYTEYSKLDRTYVLPHILTGPEVVLPLSQARWLAEQPDHILSQTEVNRQFLEADHTFLHHNIVREPVHPEVIRRELTHKLSSFTGDIVDELERSLAENWGTDTETWNEIRTYDTMLDVITRLSTRIFVGEDLCRNREFSQAVRSFDRNVVVSAAALNLMPGFLKPILGPILSAYDYLQYRTMAKFVIPLIIVRLSAAQPGEKLPLVEDKAHNDYIQWAIDHARAHWDPVERTPTVIARRLACLCFAAIQSSVISITNCLYDIAASPYCADYLDGLREEVLSEVGDQENCIAPGSSQQAPWSKASLARMVRVDSTLRESMRLNGFVARGIMKRVAAPGGVTLPDGTHVPRGTKVGIQAYSVHRDEDIYPDAERYDAFRFCAQNETVSVDRQGDDPPGKEKTPPQALVSTSPTFLAFSHGPNACPGRFFAANQLKLTLAHVALLYEIEPVARRPENKWFVGSMAPPMRDTLRVRRRKI